MVGIAPQGPYIITGQWSVSNVDSPVFGTTVVIVIPVFISTTAYV